MMESVEIFLSKSGKSMKRSAIREILKVLEKPEMISFAGGLPAPETFPVEDLREIVLDVLENEGAEALQYSTTEGDMLLRRMLVGRHNSQGLNIGIENLIITTGSQQALDLVGKIFIDPGDHVLCGLPSYLGGLNAFSSHGAKLNGITLDKDGMKTDVLEETIIELKESGQTIKFIYVIPDFQNPAGITTSENRRLETLEIAEKYNLLVIEDSPYREIRFSGRTQRLMYDLDTTGRVITLFTFSKIFAPGFRVGWMIGNPAILDRIVMAKQTADLCTSAFVQKILARYLQKGLLEKNLEKTITLYSQRCSYMIKCLGKYMPENVIWTEPDGGLFLFVTLPENLDTGKILTKAIGKNVAFVAGSTFFCDETRGHNTMRINFSFSDNNEIEEGVRRLALVINEELTGKK